MAGEASATLLEESARYPSPLGERAISTASVFVACRRSKGGRADERSVAFAPRRRCTRKGSQSDNSAGGSMQPETSWGIPGVARELKRIGWRQKFNPEENFRISC